MLQFLLFQVVAVETVVGTDPQQPVELLSHARGRTIVQTILPEEVGPVLGLEVHAAYTHGGGDIDTLAVRRERDGREVVVDDAVKLTVGLGPLVGGIELLLIGGRIHAQQSLTHGS